MPENPQDYALVVGLNDYPDYGGGGRSLKGAIRDAEKFAKWLRDTETGGGLPPNNVKLITSTAAPLAPAQDQIDDALSEIRQDAENQPIRRLYVYFSGHGHVSGESRHDVALCLPRWSRDRRNAALSSSRYLAYLEKCTPFTEIVMFLDCCRVRQVAAIGLPSNLDCPLAVGVERKTMVAYASEFLKPAFEATAPHGGDNAAGEDDSASAAGEDDEVRGHFTAALLAGLRAGAARVEGGATAHTLKRYLEANVERIAKAAGHIQRPQIPLDMKDAEADAMVFGSALPEANVEIVFRAGHAGPIELIGPTADVLKRDDVATGPWRLRLEKGLHQLRDAGTNEERTLPFVPTAEVTRVEF